MFTNRPQMNSIINQINTIVATFVSDVRRNPKYRDRLFTSNKKSLSGYILSSKGENEARPSLTLNERGKKLLWLRLKDALNRSLNLVPPKRRQQSRNANVNFPRNNNNHEDQ